MSDGLHESGRGSEMTRVWTAAAKINIFLKLIGRRADGYHLISSRFVRYDELCDKMWFEKAGRAGFEVIGDFGCASADNTISRALTELGRLCPSKKLFDFASSHRVVVYKQIPSGAGLGGASSNAATFLLMINEMAELGLSKEELLQVGVRVGADVPFFVSGERSANVGGIGEVITPFDEPKLSIALKTVPIMCETAKVYQSFRQHHSDHMEFSAAEAVGLLAMQSREILRANYPEKLNDLYLSAFKSYPELTEYREDGWFLSGSGGTFFKAAQ